MNSVNYVQALQKISAHVQFDGADTLYSPIEKVAELLPGNVALRFMGKNITYRKLKECVDKYASALTKIGLTQGEAVTAALPNIPESAYILYAAAKAGLRFSPLHPLLPPEGIRAAIDKTASRIIFVLDTAAKEVAEACPNATVIAVCPANSLAVGKIFYKLKNPMPEARDNLYRLSDFLKGKCTLNEKPSSCPAHPDTAILLQSGGTTGTPKVIGLSTQSVNNLARKGLSILGKDQVADCGMLSVLPVFHGFGLAMGMHAMLCHGGKNVLFPKFHRASAVKEILKGNVQFVIGVPRLYEALLSHPDFRGEKLKNLVVAFVGGDFVPHTLLTAFDKRVRESGGTCRLLEGYGLTETVTVCCVNVMHSNRDCTVGKPIDGITVEAFDFENGTEMSERGQKGELAVSGDTLMTEYLCDPEATEKVFFDHKGEKYVRTGDCGYVDEDGFVHFLSRIKRIVKVRGIPVYPLEIEQLVATVDGVTGVCAVGIPDGTEESILLFVESKKSDIGNEISSLIREKISEFAVPKEVIILPDFPYTTVSKIDAKKLLSDYTGGKK